MTFFVWDASYEGGVKEIDDQHRKLVDMINGLHDAMLVGEGAQLLGTLFQDLIDYTRYHFETEERLLERAGYPGIGDQIKEHRSLTEHVLAYQKRFEEGRFKNAVETVKFLKGWLAQHILEKDIQAMQYINRK